MKTKIIYEDKHILVCRKPAGLATQTAKVGEQDMVSELKNYLIRREPGKTPYLGVVHRLDQPVEGLLVFARTKEAAAELTRQLKKGVLHKQYYAVSCGEVRQEAGELVDYLFKDPSGKAKVVTGETVRPQDAKRAVMQYRTLKQVSVPEPLAFMEIQIETGRFHQIRAQMAAAGMPLLGDFKYGGDTVRGISKALGVTGAALCAYRIRFRHPAGSYKDKDGYLEFEIQPEGKAFAYLIDNN